MKLLIGLSLVAIVVSTIRIISSLGDLANSYGWVQRDMTEQVARLEKFRAMLTKAPIVQATATNQFNSKVVP